MSWNQKTKIVGGTKNTFQDIQFDGSLVVSDIHDARIQNGISFRAETSGLTIAAGATKTYIGITSGNTIETWFQVSVETNDTIKYKVYLEPTGTTGTLMSISSRNPHVQYLGGRSAVYTLYDNPTFSTAGTIIRNKTIGTWGIPYESKWTILSPNQALMFEFENPTASAVSPNIVFWLEEVEDGVDE